MWYAPIGSFEYTLNLHNDILIKKYILSEQRLKQQNRLSTNPQLLTQKEKKETKTSSGVDAKDKNKLSDNRINRIKGCSVDVRINRSYKKTTLDVVTYDSTYKK